MHRDRLSSILLHNGIVSPTDGICGTTFVLASTIFDFESCTPTFKNIKHLTSSAGSLKVAASVPPYSAYLLLTLSMNSKLNPPTLLLILHLVYNTKKTTQIWICGFLYVDDLALMSTCPRELQAMLHVCQEWSVRNRMQINTQKTKVMAFFETPSLHKARGGQHRPGPTLPPFHVHAPFPTSSPCSY